MADLKAFAEQLVSLTVKEVNELAQILKEEYGIEPAAAATVVAGPAVAASDAEQAEEKSTFELRYLFAAQWFVVLFHLLLLPFALFA
jgi:large subunit ribosomal protein L7/L12